MALYEIEDALERVLLIGVSEQDGDDAEDSLEELAELVHTAGAQVVGTLIQKRERIHPGTYVGTGKVAEIAEYLGISDSTYLRKHVLGNLEENGYLEKSKVSRAVFYKTCPDMVNLE